MIRLQKEFTAYMKKALKCDAIDFYRRCKTKEKYKSVVFEDINKSGIVVSLNGEITIPDFSFFDSKHKNKKLEYAISKLNERNKEIFELYSIYDLKASEIAEKMDISEDNVYQIISRTKKNFGGRRWIILKEF